MSEYIASVSGQRRTQDWTPKRGQEHAKFLRRVGLLEHSADYLSDAMSRVLSRGIQPNSRRNSSDTSSTGLVVGYVQSGKTMAFELLAALARDNGFAVVIVLAGVSNALLAQSTTRLIRDLGAQEDDSGWTRFASISLSDVTPMRTSIELALDDEAPPPLRKTVLLPVLKHHQRIRELASVFDRIRTSGVPVLIIDDEADQAGLNASVNSGEASSTYEAILNLRNTVPQHAYVQFTATPQAPLLVSLADLLSPDFVEILQPGDGYVGGKEIFLDSGSQVIRNIPATDVPDADDLGDEPPASLLQALRLFLVGSADELSRGETARRSMLVHPSRLVHVHHAFAQWIEGALWSWRELSAVDPIDPAYQDFADLFRTAYEDVRATVGSSMASFEAILRNLKYVLLSARVRELNGSSGSDPVDWSASNHWVLVGGQVLDRGFTVEGLTVTYMPRQPGVGNADTIQQRGRFFGYKRKYLQYCRIFLEENTLIAFESYVRHEEDIRSQLDRVSQSGEPLDAWKRAFVLDPTLKPCRNSVLENGYIRFTFADNWVVQGDVRQAIDAPTAVEHNRRVLDQLQDVLEWEEFPGSPKRTASQSHQVSKGVTLRTVMSDLLAPYRAYSPQDSDALVALILLLQRQVELNGEETRVDIVRMSPDYERRRGLTKGGRVAQLFQGADPSRPASRKGEVYPGDREIVSKSNPTIQIHRLTLTRGRGSSDPTIAGDIPVLAVRVPEGFADSYVVQESG